LAMIETDLKPIGQACVTVVASIVGRHMIRSFTAGDNIVVAISTRSTGLVVGKRCYVSIPTGTGGVTQLAGIGRIWVRSGFVTGVVAGVARHTRIGGLIVRKWSD
jgi:hypothetical protein